MLYVLIILACAILNRVRGGGFYGDLLPGRALFWVTPVIGLLAWTVLDPLVSLGIALAYLVWAAPAWGFVLSLLGSRAPDRDPDWIEDLLMRLPGTYLPALARMFFVLPGMALVAYLAGNPAIVLLAPAFAVAATEIYARLFDPIGTYDWMRAEIATGGLWGVVILLVLALTMGGCAPRYDDGMSDLWIGVKCTQEGTC